MPRFELKFTAPLQGWSVRMRWAAPAMAVALTAAAAGFAVVEAEQRAANPAHATAPRLAEIVKVY